MTSKASTTKTTKTTRDKRKAQQISYDDFEVKEKFKELLPRLNDNDYAELKRSIQANGCRDPLVVWRCKDGEKILIDGHHRYEICTDAKKPYDVKFMSFDSEDEAIAWMLDNQRSRRNLNSFQLAETVWKHKDYYKKLFKASWRKRGKASDQNSDSGGVDDKKPDSRAYVYGKMGKLAGISHDTMSKIGTILEVANNNPNNIILQRKVKALRDGLKGVSVNSVYAIVKEIRDINQHNPPKPKPQTTTTPVDRAISRLNKVEEKLSTKDERMILYNRVIEWAKDKQKKTSS